MMNYSDQELEKLLDDLESDFIERKEAWSGETPDRARQAVCAFANDLPNRNKPGVLFIGAKDKDGSPSGLQITDKLLLTIADMKTDGKILPFPALTVEKRVLKGAEMIVVLVQPSDMPPVKYEGRIWIRVGPRRAIANEQDERLLSEKRRYKHIPFDIRPIESASLKDLNRLRFEQEYLPHAFAPDVLEANGRSYEERLASCQMIASVDTPTPTVLGLLTLCDHPLHFLPGAYIQFLRVDGVERSDPIIDELLIDGPIALMLRRLDEKLIGHNRVKIDIAGSIEKRTYDYPLVALQQVCRNALMHRQYESTHAPVQIYWFNDRIEVINPGGPYGQVTRENFGNPGWVDYRNPNVAGTMKVLGFVQRFGVGIKTAQEELKRNGNLPAEYTIDLTRIMCTVKKRV